MQRMQSSCSNDTSHFIFTLYFAFTKHKFLLGIIIIYSSGTTININPDDWSSYFPLYFIIFYSYRDKAWAWRCLEHFLKYLPSHTYYVQLSLKALTLLHVFSVGIQDDLQWYTSFLRSVRIIDYDGLACRQKRKCLVILTTILLFSIIPCFVYHSLLTKAKPEAVKSQTNNYNSNKSKWISTKTKRHQLGDWICPGGCLLWNPDDQNLGQATSDVQATQF